MRVSKRLHLKASLVGTGFPFKELVHLDAYLAMLRDVMKGSAGVRRAGSAALDLAYVAAGRLDGFWEIGLARWDMAAGSLLITEAGGLVGDLEGNEGYMESGSIVAGTPKVFGEIAADEAATAGEQRVAVGRRSRHHLGGDQRCPVVDHYLPARPFRQAFHDQPGQEVVVPSRRRGDDANDPGRKLLREHGTARNRCGDRK